MNDPPSCTVHAFPATTDESRPQTVPNWITNCSPGPPNESTQQLTISVTVDKPAYFSALPAVHDDGTLTFTPAPNVRGSGLVTVTIHDDGGTASGGADTTSVMLSFNVDKPHPWQNTVQHLDATADKHIAPDDALAIINYINANFASKVAADALIGQPFGFLDVNGDNNVAPNDALDIINVINAGQGGEGEGQGTEVRGQKSEVNAQAMNDLFALLAADVDVQPRRRW